MADRPFSKVLEFMVLLHAWHHCRLKRQGGGEIREVQEYSIEIGTPHLPLVPKPTSALFSVDKPKSKVEVPKQNCRVPETKVEVPKRSKSPKPK